MWPHELQTQIAVGLKNDSGIRSRCSSENENLDTKIMMKKLDDVHLVSDSENEAPSKISLPISKAEMEVNWFRNFLKCHEFFIQFDKSLNCLPGRT